MNKKIHQIALQTGGSHYPDVGGELLEQFARKIIDECIIAVQNTNKHHAYTTFDLGMVEATIEKSVASILDAFEL
jgi:hypothetical protein